MFHRKSTVSVPQLRYRTLGLGLAAWIVERSVPSIRTPRPEKSRPGQARLLPRRPVGGYTLVELLVTLVVASFGLALAVPSLLEVSAKSRVHLAAAELAGAFNHCRSLAVKHNTHVGVRFRVEESGAVTYTLYRDGDGDGVRNADIDSGTDPQATPRAQLQGFGSTVRFGFPPGLAPRDPGSRYRRLDRLDDPVRFNRSDIAAFGPLGTATPGSLYFTDGKQQVAAVRVFGRTGKVRIIHYDRESETWR